MRRNKYYRTDWVWPTGNGSEIPHQTRSRMVQFVPEGWTHHDVSSCCIKEEDSRRKFVLPTWKVRREYVDDTRRIRRPTRNFGDYDPVRSAPPKKEYHEPLAHLSEKQLKRRVIYTGMPSETEMQARVKLKRRYQRSLYEDEEETFEQVETEGFQSTAGRQPHHSGLGTETSGFGIGGGRRASLNQQADNDASSWGPRPMFDEHNNSNIAAAGRTATVTGNNLNRSRSGVGPNSSLETSFNTDTRESRRNMSANFGGFGGSTRMQSSATATSSWMQYTGGTGGFYNPSAAASNQALGDGSSVASGSQSFEPFEYGYSTSKQGTSGNVCEQFDSGSNETEFCCRINNLNIYYELKMLPNQSNHGKIYYGFELQFWPYDDPSGKEVVWGLRMLSLAHAKDSAFAAALAKLPCEGESDAFPFENTDPHILNQGERKPAYSAQSEEARGHQAQSATSFSDRREGYKVTFSTASGAREATSYSLPQQRIVSNRAAPAQTTVRDDWREREPVFSTSHIASKAATSSRHSDFKNPAQQQQTQVPLMSYQNPRPWLQPKVSRSVVSENKDDGFRIAIPRDPSIVWDTKHYRKQLVRITTTGKRDTVYDLESYF